MFRHPKYYKELRKRNKSDQVISLRAATAGTGVHPGPGLKRQASSAKHQAKPKPVRVQASSIKRQASKPQAQASSFKPQAASSLIRVPRYKNTEEVFLGKGPRAFTMINVFLG